ncbi:unnamed protein product [Leuciscus chuanchicus]
MHGGVTKVPLTRELLTCVGAARSRYRIFLDLERTRKESEMQSQKRKLAEDGLEQLKKRKTSLKEASNCLAREADMLAEEAEGKAGSKMTQLLSKSNALRRAYKDKMAELRKIEAEIGAKGEELSHMAAPIMISEEQEKAAKDALCPPSHPVSGEEDNIFSRADYLTLQGQVEKIQVLRMAEVQGSPVPVPDLSIRCGQRLLEVSL